MIALEAPSLMGARENRTSLCHGYMWNIIILKKIWNYFRVLFHMQPRLKLKYNHFSHWMSS